MRFLPLVLSASLCCAAVVPQHAIDTCTDPPKRIEWRQLGAETQKQYIDAVLCLKTKSSNMGLNTTRYDDFPYIHTHLDKTSSYFVLISIVKLHEKQKLTSRAYSS